MSESVSRSALQRPAKHSGSYIRNGQGRATRRETGREVQKRVSVLTLMSIMSSWHLCMQMFTRDNQPLPKGTVPYTPHRHCGDCGIRIYSITWHGLGLDALLDLDRLGMVSSKRNTIRACFGRRMGEGGGETGNTKRAAFFLIPEESVGWDGQGV